MGKGEGAKNKTSRQAHTTGTADVKIGMAKMLKGGVIMDVVDAEQARIVSNQCRPHTTRALRKNALAELASARGAVCRWQLGVIAERVLNQTAETPRHAESRAAGPRRATPHDKPSERRPANAITHAGRGRRRRRQHGARAHPRRHPRRTAASRACPTRR